VKHKEYKIKEEPEDYGILDSYATVLDDNSEMYPDSEFLVNKFEPMEESLVKEIVKQAPKKQKRAKVLLEQQYCETFDDKDSDYEVIRNDKGKVECKFCSKTFTKPHSMKCHVKAMHTEISETEMHKCEECGKLFKLKYYLREYLKTPLFARQFY
jgi:uncharacterized Zn-finger protein